MNETPRSNRLHIAFFGKRNSGKSSLINALTSQTISVVSDVPGTTTDPVLKAMEIHGIGPCVFIDTAGLDDEGQLGELRIKQTLRVMERTDIALMVCTDGDITREMQWAGRLKEKDVPVIWVLTPKQTMRHIEQICGQVPLPGSAKQSKGTEEIHRRIAQLLPDETMNRGLLGGLVEEGETVMLVMPQDLQAPKGRLILPQVQTIRELLDRKCLVMSCTTDKMDQMLQALARPPRLIITDSQAFKTVYEKKPKDSRLTSFSILFAQYKGDIDYFLKGAEAIGRLTEDSRVLIAEACTHAPMTEDIGRVKIPNMLRKRIGGGLQIDVVSGNDFPEDPSPYSLVIHCGACMFTRKYVLNRIASAKEQHVPMTNYGVAIACLTGILDKVEITH